MDPKALALCARFALTPNQLGYCGTSQASQILQNCIFKKDFLEAEQELQKFIILNPYLQTIAQICDLDPFSYPVIEAYWFGNDLLKKCEPQHYDLLLQNFTKQGVPDFLIKELKNRRPKIFIPIHLFNILFVGVGRASGSVPFTLHSINNCMIRWGKILELKPETHQTKIILNSLSSSNSAKGRTSAIYSLTPKTKTLTFDSQFTPNLKIGDTIAVHWHFIPKKLTIKEIQNLQFWTEKLITNI